MILKFIKFYLQYKISQTSFTAFTILTWWYGIDAADERAIISVIKDKSFGTGFHLHAGCKGFPDEICLTFANRDRNGLYSMKQLTTNDQPLALPLFPKWTYFGFTYKKSTKGELSWELVIE